MQKNFVKISFIITLLFSFALAGNTLAAIDLPWFSTWNCSEYIPSSDVWNPPAGCDGTIYGLTGSCTEHLYSEILIDANHPGGEGNGFRSWNCDGQNHGSFSIYLKFNELQKEIWVRHYIRYQEGFSWSSGYPDYDKLLYLRSNGDGAQGGFQPYGNTFRFWSNSSGSTLNASTDCGWNAMMGGALSDGSWHCLEFHVKMDTDTTDGVAQAWIDGILRINSDTFNWSGGNVTVQQGWAGFDFNANQASPSGGPYYIDFDDIVVTDVPSNVDSDGNPFIGPIGWREPEDVMAPSDPNGLIVS